MNETTGSTTDTTAVILPPVPDPAGGDGYDWMEKLDNRWRPIAGMKGALIGDWPYLIVAHCNDTEAGAYGVTVYQEGSVETRAYTSRAERNRQTLLRYTTDED